MTKKKQSNKNLKIILFSLGGIILLAVILFFALNTESNPCKNYEYLGYTDKNECYMLLAMDSNDVSYCNKIDNVTNSNNCIIFYASSKEDSSVCDLINNELQSALCYNFYANQTGDYDACYEISNKQYQSYCLGNLGSEPISSESNSNLDTQEIEEKFDLGAYGNYLNTNDDKLDCSKTSNYNQEKLDLAFDYNCYFDEESTQYYYGSCDGIQGIDKLDADVDRYPSLNENYFNSVDLTLTNIGCTKIKLEDYNIKYQLIQNNQILAETEHALDYSLRAFNNQDVSYLYPEEYGFLYLGFRDSVSFSDRSDLYFRICVYNKDNFSQAVCNQVKV